MAKICEITGTHTTFGNQVSHANNKTRRTFYPNLQKKRIFLPEIQAFVTLRLTTAALRTINKNGFSNVLKKAYQANTLSERLRPIVLLLNH